MCLSTSSCGFAKIYIFLIKSVSACTTRTHTHKQLYLCCCVICICIFICICICSCNCIFISELVSVFVMANLFLIKSASARTTHTRTIVPLVILPPFNLRSHCYIVGSFVAVINTHTYIIPIVKVFLNICDVAALPAFLLLRWRPVCCASMLQSTSSLTWWRQWWWWWGSHRLSQHDGHYHCFQQHQKTITTFSHQKDISRTFTYMHCLQHLQSVHSARSIHTFSGEKERKIMHHAKFHYDKDWRSF